MFDRVLEALSAGLLAALVGITFLTVIYRYIIQSSLAWSYEVLLGLLVYLTFFSGFLALRKGAHLRIDVLISHLPGRARLTVYLLNQSLVIGVALVMLIWGTEQTLAFNDRRSLMLDIPMSVFYVIIPLAGAAMIVECSHQILGMVRRFHKGDPPYPRTLSDRSDGADGP